MRDKKFLTDSQSFILDIFRICAAVFVMVGHSFSFYKLTIFKDDHYFTYIQNIGVVMLFTMSGFLLAYSLERRNYQDFHELLIHRTLRFWKEYIPALIAVALIDYVAIKYNGTGYSYMNAFNFKTFTGNIFMLQATKIGDFLNIAPFGSARPLWSLSVEYCFYLLAGYVYIIIRTKNFISVKGIILSGLLVIQSVKHVATGGGIALAFALGIFAYYFYERISSSAAKFLFVMSIILYIFYGIKSRNAYSVHSYLLIFAFLCSILKIAGLYSFTCAGSSIVKYISNSSFMLYLLHYSIIDFIKYSDITFSTWTKFSLGIIISLVLSFVMYYLFGYKAVRGKH